jgi:hypothetical protein
LTGVDQSRRCCTLACPEGIEPPTHSLEGCCSIQLSYGQRSKDIDGRGERIRTFDPLVPNQMRYQAALRPDESVFYRPQALALASMSK